METPLPSPESRITLEDIATYPLPGNAIPVALAFSPDDRLVTFLHSSEGSLVRQLYQFEPQTGEQHLLLTPPADGASEENLSLEEKLRRERQRQLGLGVTSYAWAKQGSQLLVPLPDGLYVVDEPGAKPRQVASSKGGALLDPRFSPDGEWIAYVQQNELFCVPATGGACCQLTFGAQESGKTHGLAEFIAQEEMGCSEGFWWSPDGELLAFKEVDETHIPIYRILHQGQDSVGEGAQEDHRYPFAGQANARDRLGVVLRSGGDVVWMDLGPDEDFYLARVDWFPEGSLAVQIENREQTRLDLMCFDPQTGKGNLVLRESNETWINLHELFRPLKKAPYAGYFVWASERTGFCHLYLMDAQGEIVRPLTSGEWMVDSLEGVDEERGVVYFTGTLDSPLECHLYAVLLEGGNVRRITRQPGTHAINMDHGFNCFIDTAHSLEQPPQIGLYSLADGSLLHMIYNQPEPRLERLRLQPPEMVMLHSRDGAKLYGALYRPAAAFGKGPYPTIVSVYGGPHAQMVVNGWGMTAAMRAQYLREQGFLIFVLDNRGSAHRGLAFEGTIKHFLGNLEVQDQVDGVHWLVEQELADPQRVGIYGWSYGGYMAAMCLARAPEVFKAAVAGAPVTAWDGYDTHYTERYMGTPQSNPDGYRDGSVMTHVEKMTGRLMLVHGLIDENVHFRHTARLINALIQARKTYDLLLFPDERHMPRRLADRVFMEEQLRDFFLKYL